MSDERSVVLYAPRGGGFFQRETRFFRFEEHEGRRYARVTKIVLGPIFRGAYNEEDPDVFYTNPTTKQVQRLRMVAPA